MHRMLAILLLLGACGGTEKSIEKYCKLELECEPGSYASQEACVAEGLDGYAYTLDNESEDCIVAQEELLKCMSKLGNCTDYNAYWEEPTADYPCNEEDDATYAACY